MDFSAPGIGAAIGERIKAEINAYSSEMRPQRYSTRLSPSSLGEECPAETWYKWRWVQAPEPQEGRMARYNQRGEDEESRVVALLRATGWTVQDVEPLTGEQLAISDLSGHLYGKLDGEASHPVHTGGLKVLFENKFVNYKRFTVLTNIEKPLPVADAKYYGQICLYMKYRNLAATMFVCGNRNDDDIEFRFFPRNDPVADDLVAKGQSVMFSKVRPARISESPAFYKCKFCDQKGVCHEGEPVAINCRSCVNCVPAEGGKFFCEHWQKIIPSKAAILAACGQHWPVK